MSLSASSWGSTLGGVMDALLFLGPDKQKFADAIGEGSANTLKGKSFATIDTGTVPGTGTGQGVGLIGVPPGVVSSLIFALATAQFGGAGPQLAQLALAIETALLAELLKVSLKSDHTPVFLGTGIIVPGSIPVTGAEWGANITQAGNSKGFAGPQWPQFASVIGNACATGMRTATGIVVITGTGSPPTSPGIGTGQGTIS